MVIIEGPDNAGKTKLSAELVKDFNRCWGFHMQEIHLTRLPNCHDRCFDYVASMMYYGIFDRFHLSEEVYHIARDDGTEPLLTEERLRYVNARLTLMGCVHIVLLPTDDLIKRRWDQSIEMYPPEITLRAAQQYREMPRHRFNIDFVYEFDDDIDFTFIANDILQLHLQRRLLIESLKRKDVPLHAIC